MIVSLKDYGVLFARDLLTETLHFIYIYLSKCLRTLRTTEHLIRSKSNLSLS